MLLSLQNEGKLATARSEFTKIHENLVKLYSTLIEDAPNAFYPIIRCVSPPCPRFLQSINQSIDQSIH
jgi:hypothetical protein